MQLQRYTNEKTWEVCIKCFLKKCWAWPFCEHLSELRQRAANVARPHCSRRGRSSVARPEASRHSRSSLNFAKRKSVLDPVLDTCSCQILTNSTRSNDETGSDWILQVWFLILLSIDELWRPRLQLLPTARAIGGFQDPMGKLFYFVYFVYCFLKLPILGC